MPSFGDGLLEEFDRCRWSAITCNVTAAIAPMGG